VAEPRLTWHWSGHNTGALHTVHLAGELCRLVMDTLPKPESPKGARADRDGIDDTVSHWAELGSLKAGELLV